MPRDYDDPDPDREYDERDDDRPRRRPPADDTPPPRKANVVLVAGIVGGVGAVLLVGLLIGMLVLFNSKGKDQVGRRQVGDNAHQITIGVHNYHDMQGKLGSPFANDWRGGGMPTRLTPTQRLSWRADLLPYIEQGPIYNALNTSEAWDSPTNSQFTNAGIRTYLDPLDPSDNQTRFRAFYDNGAVWDSSQRYGISMVGITDGTSNTILFVDATERVPWAQFNELKFEPNGTLPELGHPQRTAFVAAMADGSVKWLKKTISPTTLKAAITRAGNESLGPDFTEK